MSGSYVSNVQVYGLNMKDKRYPLLVAVAQLDGRFAHEEYVCGVAPLIKEPYLPAEFGWVATPSKGVYHQTEKRED